VILAVFFEVFGDLRGEFARRLQNERARHTSASASLFEQRQHRQHEGRGLAGPCLGNAADVTALKRKGDCTGLDRSRCGVARVSHRGKDFLAQAKVSKCCQREI